MDLVEPELRDVTPYIKPTAIVMTELLSDPRIGHDTGAGEPAAIDEKEDIWEIGVLFAKWRQGESCTL